MIIQVFTFKDFDKEAKRLSKKYHTLAKDIAALVAELKTNQNLGVDLGGGVRKVRMAITAKGKGKSHGARVITYTVTLSVNEGIITLLTIYDKADRDTITAKEIATLLQDLEKE